MLELNKIYNADCLDLMKEIPDKYFDLVLTDPPYGIGIGGNGKIGGNGFITKVTEYKKVNWDANGLTAEQWTGLKRISKNQIIFGYNYFADIIGNSRGIIVWDKKRQEWDDNFSDIEIAYTSFDKPAKCYRHLWMGALRGSEKSANTRFHPTQKPVKLFEWCLKNYSKENDIVLDCFSGSGVTAIACHNLNRNFICIEKDKDYYEKSVKRYEEHIKQFRIF